MDILLRYVKRKGKNMEQKTHPKGRAWMEINLEHLHYNVREMESVLPLGCKIMAVLKANALGHGDVEIAKELNQLGIKDFAVATLEEAVNLRCHNIEGEILIFGYTYPEDFKLLAEYNLIQTCVDYEFAKALNQFGQKIKIHIKLDTGMHRLGERSCNTEGIKKIFNLENLQVDGTYTHLSVSDSKKVSDIIYTENQIKRFNEAILTLKSHGFNPGKLHVQGTYGVLNYPEHHYDYARLGISLYGALSKEGDKTKIQVDLKPILSIKARVVLIKKLFKGDEVSYGRKFKAPDTMIAAVISIGYADGIARNVSDASFLIHGKRAPIIGRICMDQLIVDVTGIPEAKPNDTVTIVGVDGNEKVTAEELAGKSGTISNEFLSRLGNRLTRIYYYE